MAERLIVLGTGNAMATRCYNTCFALDAGGDFLLVDAGGGNTILRRLEQAALPAARLRHMIVTHAHCDHVLGTVWVLRKIASMMCAGAYDGVFHIWCHAHLVAVIQTMAELTLQKKWIELFGKRILFHTAQDGACERVGAWEVTFFDIHSTKEKQYGFTLRLQNGEKLTCLGDEPYNPVCAAFVQKSDWLLCEAFCLYEQRQRFRPYEKHHSTVRDACLLAKELGAGHLVLWHTEDESLPRRKALYTAEGAAFYDGDLYVPDDLDVIELTRRKTAQE